MPSGTGHFTGSSKRVEAHPKRSNLVVNSVALSRDLPVFTGFFEIIRVVLRNILVFYLIKTGKISGNPLTNHRFCGIFFDVANGSGD